jgi:hypothetical protein
MDRQIRKINLKSRVFKNQINNQHELQLNRHMIFTNKKLTLITIRNMTFLWYNSVIISISFYSKIKKNI